MSGIMIFLVLLASPQDTKKAEAPAKGAKKKAAVVDRIMAEPPNPVAPRPKAPTETAIFMRGGQPMKRIMLELKEVEAAADAEEAQQPFGIGRPIDLNELALSKDNFDAWVFGDTLSTEARKHRLETLLSDKVSSVEKDRPLEPEQLRKLRLAGNGDLKRFFDRSEAARVEFEAVRQDYQAGRRTLLQFEPLSTEYQAGPFGPDSVFAKTLRKMQGDEKAATPVSK